MRNAGFECYGGARDWRLLVTFRLLSSSTILYLQLPSRSTISNYHRLSFMATKSSAFLRKETRSVLEPVAARNCKGRCLGSEEAVCDGLSLCDLEYSWLNFVHEL